MKQQKRATFIILYDDQVVASGSPQLLFVVVSLALTFKFCLSPPSLCYRLTPIGAALSCKKDAKRPKLAQNSLRWPILADSIGGQSCKSAECLSVVRPHNSYPDHLNALGGSEGPIPTHSRLLSYLLLHFNPLFSCPPIMRHNKNEVAVF